jgi:S-adenosylmethionine-diacylglycerol 3-amino-3-carboxypropyl transferase
MSTEIAGKAGFDRVRYAQLWEDADVLCEALGDRRRDVLVSIASAGDNALAMLTLDPREVIAVDMSKAQTACVRFRKTAWPILDHEDLLMVMGFGPKWTGSLLTPPYRRRGAIFDRVLQECDPETAGFWEGLRSEVLMHGVGAVGKFERYFDTFRRLILPLTHSRADVAAIFEPRSREERERFLERRWNNLRWRLLLRVFFSKTAMGALGRDPAFFDHVEGSLPEHVARGIRRAFVDQDPVANPYLRWIMTGNHGPRLPLAFRPENHRMIQERIDRLRVVDGTIEDLATDGVVADGWNLSDIFEYMSPDGFERTYGGILDASAPDARLVYWNMMVPRSLPSAHAARAVARTDVSAPLALKDQAFFYSALHVDDMRP